MATNVELGQHSTKKVTANAAPPESAKSGRAHLILELFGKVEFTDGYDPKSNRSR